MLFEALFIAAKKCFIVYLKDYINIERFNKEYYFNIH